MGKMSRSKGQRIERQALARLRDFGLDADRVPLSGAAGGRYADDLVIYTDTHDYRCEVKGRATGTGFARLYDWMESAIGGIYRINDDLICMDEDALEALMRADETGLQEFAQEMLDGVKTHSGNLKTIYRWIKHPNTDFLMVKKDRAPFLFVLKNSMLAKVMNDESDAT